MRRVSPLRSARPIRASGRTSVVSAVVSVSLVACSVLSPPELPAERDRLHEGDARWSKRFEQRDLPPLADSPTLEAVLERAFAANAELESAYYEWAAALERVPQATALPDTQVSFRYLFSDAKMRSWDRTTLGAQQLVPYPGRLRRAGRVALQEAVAARHRLEDRKFELQSRVVAAWSDLAFIDRTIAIDEQNVTLLRQIAAVTRQLVAVGRAPQADASKADLEVASAQNDLASKRAERRAALAALNALLSRPVDTPLHPAASGPPSSMPSDAAILALAAERNPSLADLAARAQASEDALELARLAYVPDLTIGIDVRGSMEQMSMTMLTLPLQLGRIRAEIAEAAARRRVAEAALRERYNQIGARVALALFLARDSERQLALFREVLLPRARDVVAATATTYATGGVAFLALIDAQRALLALGLAEAGLEATHAKAVAELEALCALDFGALSRHAGARS